MGKIATLAGLGCVCAFTLGAGRASALGTTYGATYQGVASGVDALGLFGAKGASLNGAAYSEMFLINTQAGTKRIGANQQDEWGSSASFITAYLTINGKTTSVRSSVYGEAFVNDGGDVDNASSGVYYTQGYAGADTYHAVYDSVAGASSVFGYLGVTSSYADNANATFIGFPTSLDQAFATGVGTSGTTGVGSFELYAEGCLTEAESLTLRETVAAAPEPGTWSLLLAGVAALGISLRLNRRRSDAAIGARSRACFGL